MAEPRTILLFDPAAKRQVWNERMSNGEYAVLPSFEAATSSVPSAALHKGPSCTIFTTYSEAEDYAREQVVLHPALRCRIYDSEVLVSRRSSRRAGRPIVRKVKLALDFDDGVVPASF